MIVVGILCLCRSIFLNLGDYDHNITTTVIIVSGNSHGRQQRGGALARHAATSTCHHTNDPLPYCTQLLQARLESLLSNHHHNITVQHGRPLRPVCAVLCRRRLAENHQVWISSGLQRNSCKWRQSHALFHVATFVAKQ